MTELLPLVLMAVLSAVMVGFILVRRLRQQHPWGVVDGLLAVGLMLWLSSTALIGAEVLRLGPSALDSGQTPPLASALVGTALGSIGAAAYAVLRARSGGGLERLGVARAPASAWGLAVLAVPVFIGISWGWSLLLEAWGMPAEPQFLVQEITAHPTSPTSLAAMAYGIAVAPVVEELLFRGFLLVPLVRPVGRGLAVSMTAAVFAALHLSDPASIVPLFVLGQILGWLRLHGRSLGPPVLLHVLNNSFAFAVALWAGGA